MKKRLLAAAVTGAVMLSAGAQAQDKAAPEGYQLQQVLIMSRHNLRAPSVSYTHLTLPTKLEV